MSPLDRQDEAWCSSCKKSSKVRECPVVKDEDAKATAFICLACGGVVRVEEDLREDEESSLATPEGLISFHFPTS